MDLDPLDPMDAIKQTFFQECEEQLAELESGLLAIQAGDTDPETVNAVFRAVHSIKGGAGAFALDALVRYAHVFETSLDKLRSERLVPGPAALLVMLRAADALADLVRATRDKTLIDTARNDALGAELAAVMVAPAPGSASVVAATSLDQDGMGDFVFAPIKFDTAVSTPEFMPLAISNVVPMASLDTSLQGWTVRFRPLASLYAKGNETALLLRELARLGPTTAKLDLTDLPDLQTLDPEGAYLAWTIEISTEEPESTIRDLFEFVDGECELSVQSLRDTGYERLSTIVADLVARPESPEPALAPQLGKSSLAVSGESHLAAALAEPGTKMVDTPKANVAPAASKAEEPPRALVAKPTIRVDLERLDRLIDLVGELVINQAMLAQRVLEAGLVRSSNVAMGLDELEQLTRGIQDSVMAIRAQPVKSVFQRLPRLAREVAAMTGKQIRLLTEGEGTEVDKTVIEHLSDPLTHMIRNAIDHGVEAPEVRIQNGKPVEGTIRLAALHRSGRVVIEISDDGAGINRPRVRASAIEKGLIPADAALSDEEIDNLIFMPGFSTAETVSDISGRGVGMDVVRRSIQALGGRISIASRPGEGSKFTMSLPLTLAVLDGMVVTVAGQTLIVPLTAIIETLQPKPHDVHGLGGGSMVISIRGSYVPLIDVGVSLGYRDASPPAGTCVALLIEGEGGARAALLVDAIQGQRQVVIKSLEVNYRHVPGVAAATILGDGRVALILDIDTIAASARTDVLFNERSLAHA